MKKVLRASKKALALGLATIMVVLNTASVIANEPVLSDNHPAHLEGVHLELDLDNMHLMRIENMFQDDPVLRAQFLESQVVMTRQMPAIRAYNVIMEAFMDENGRIVYPDNYAGAFIQYDTLIIQLTDTSPETLAFYTSLLVYNAPIDFALVNFSLNQLSLFGEMFLGTIDAPIVSFGYDTMENRFEIVLYENSQDSVSTANSFNVMRTMMPIPIAIELAPFVDSSPEYSAMEIESTVETYLEEIGIQSLNSNLLFGGSQITNPSWRFSTALTGQFRPWDRANSFNALLTSGHPFIGFDIGTSVFHNGVPIGYLYEFRAGPVFGGRNAFINSRGDWAIIQLNNIGTMRMTPQLQIAGIPVRGTMPLVPVNTHVFGTGQVTTSWGGTVSRVNESLNMVNIGITATGLHRVELSSDSPTNGDSGGTIFTLSNNNAYLVGNLVGGSTNSNFIWGFRRFYFDPLNNIVGRFDPTIARF